LLNKSKITLRFQKKQTSRWQNVQNACNEEATMASLRVPKSEINQLIRRRDIADAIVEFETALLYCDKKVQSGVDRLRSASELLIMKVAGVLIDHEVPAEEESQPPFPLH
jgi:hypothetical protein